MKRTTSFQLQLFMRQLVATRTFPLKGPVACNSKARKSLVTLMGNVPKLPSAKFFAKLIQFNRLFIAFLFLDSFAIQSKLNRFLLETILFHSVFCGSNIPFFRTAEMLRNIITNRRYQLEAFTLLLILTPFIMLQNYLQHAIGTASRFSFEIFSTSIPLLLLVAFIAFAVIIAFSVKKITLIRIGFALLALIYWGIGQITSDFYFDHRFYDLQHNWHYIAYGIFSILFYRRVQYSGLSPATIMLRTAFFALLISTFDEFIQVYISDRIFDIGDIAKDFLGSIIGLILVFGVGQNGKVWFKAGNLCQKNFKEYLLSSRSVFFFLSFLAYFFLFFASILTELEFWYFIIIFTIITFSIFFTFVHISQFRIGKISISLIVIASILSILTTRHFNTNKPLFLQNSFPLFKGVPIYNGIPIPFFDFLIFPNGNFRLVDKKVSFNKRDIDTIKSLEMDILLMTTNIDGTGADGFPREDLSQFVFNESTGRALQIIRFPRYLAVERFNDFRRSGKNVAIIFHNPTN